MFAWVGATVLAVAVAATAVESVRSNVTNSPTVLGSPAITVAIHANDTTTSSTLAPVTVDEPATTATEAPSTTTTSNPETTTTGPPIISTKTYDTEGGTVRINIEGESVTLVPANPRIGWRAEVKYTGPEKVEVEFERNDEDDYYSEVEFLAEFVDGELGVTISEE